MTSINVIDNLDIGKQQIQTDDLVPNYGYVPFAHFQLFMISIVILSFIFRKHVIKFLEKNIYSKLDKYIKSNDIKTLIKALIAVSPTLIIFWYDLNYHSFSMRNLNVNNYITNKQINNILRLFGAYVIIQVAAQDLGLKTGDVQSDATKLPVLEYLLYVGAAYAITQDRSQAFLAGLMYFQLKFFASSKTKDVCFD